MYADCSKYCKSSRKFKYYSDFDWLIQTYSFRVRIYITLTIFFFISVEASHFQHQLPDTSNEGGIEFGAISEGLGY